MCIFLILNVVMVTGLLGCCFLHPMKAAMLCVWWSGCPWVQFKAGDGGDQPNLEKGFFGMDFSPRRGDGNFYHTPTTLTNAY